jgi:hypothetical protein
MQGVGRECESPPSRCLFCGRLQEDVGWCVVEEMEGAWPGRMTSGRGTKGRCWENLVDEADGRVPLEHDALSTVANGGYPAAPRQETALGFGDGRGRRRVFEGLERFAGAYVTGTIRGPLQRRAPRRVAEEQQQQQPIPLSRGPTMATGRVTARESRWMTRWVARTAEAENELSARRLLGGGGGGGVSRETPAGVSRIDNGA